MRSLALMLVACSSAAPSPRVTAPVASPTPAPTSAPTTLATPPALAAIASQVVCSANKTPAAWSGNQMKRRVYDFAAFPIALAYGPTADQPYAGAQRFGETIRVAIVAHTDRLAQCFTAALAAKPRMHTSIDFGRGSFIGVDVALTIDPFGAAHDIVVDGPATLAPCVRDTLGSLRVNRRTPRETRAKTTLKFLHVDSAKPSQPPPAAAPPELRGGCMVARDPLPVDTLELATLVVDFDPPAERGGRPRRCDRFDVDKADIRAELRRSLGRVRACYLDAAKRQPGLAGTVDTSFVLGPFGQPTNVAVTGAGDAPLHDCIAAELALFATSRAPDGAVEVHIPFALVAEPPGTWPTIDAAIAAGDLDGAAAVARKAADACRARVGVLKAYADPPSGPDARTDAAIAALSEQLAAHPDAACLDEARSTLEAIARWPVRPTATDVMPWRGAGLAEAYDRALRMLTKFDALQAPLLAFMGRALTALRRHDEAREVYLRYFAVGDHDKRRIEMTADGYAETMRLRDEGFVWEPCEENQRY